MAAAGHSSRQREKAEDLRLMVDTIPWLVWSTRPDGSAEFFNQSWLEYTGLSAEQALVWGWKVAIHPDDLPRKPTDDAVLKTCFPCHQAVKDRDFVFARYTP
jgi:PAS domain-containing protein